MKLVATLLFAGLLPASAIASTHPPIPFDEVVKRADVGFHGVVRSTREIAPEGVPMAFTIVTFEVREIAFDRTGAVGDTIELTFAGGRRGDRTVTVAGVPRFEVGDEVVLFAKHDGKRYADPIVGGPQGRFLVERDARTDRAFVLTAGRRGLSLGEQDQSVLPTPDRVERVVDGRPVWRETAAAAEAPLPNPVTAGSSSRRSSSVDAAADAPRPEHVADATEFVAAARKLAARG